MNSPLTLVLLLAFVGTCMCQTKPYQSTTDWWTAYKTKSDALYNAVSAIVVDRWDVQRNQKKQAALAHLNTLQTIDEQCQPNIENNQNQGPAISCALDQDQRMCEFGWAYMPLSTKRETCYFQMGLPHRGNCCTITVPK